MKTYKTIQEWLASSPPKESLDKILLAINRNVQFEGQRLIKEKQKSLKELSTLQSKMQSLGVSTAAIAEKEKDLVLEIKKISQDYGLDVQE